MASKAPAVEQSAWPLIPIPLQPFQTVNTGVKSADKTTKVTQTESASPKGWQSYAADGRQSIQSFWVPTLQKSNASGVRIRKIKSNSLAKNSDVNKSEKQTYLKNSREVFDKYLHQAEEKAIEYTELSNSLWRKIEAKEKTSLQEFLRKKTRFDQGDNEAFGQEYAQAIADS
ncbi:MAG: hypothetical protein JW841_14970 [Deltaproteobacteria bacterium]|nr:hypothetical protein [Deltaproteobacteria bacterium]